MTAIQRCSMRLHGVFDLPAALQLVDALGWVKPGGEVELDLSQIREFHDAGLAVLAKAIQGRGDTIHVDVRGLGARQHRMLKYLGVDLDRSERPSWLAH